jgi:hypothetical protein
MNGTCFFPNKNSNGTLRYNVLQRVLDKSRPFHDILVVYKGKYLT